MSELDNVLPKMFRPPKCLHDLKIVCRLCSGKTDLVWIFDKKFDFPQTMKDILAVITTIEISKEDIISQKICANCAATVIKMFQFRDQSIRNDKLLKVQCEELLKNNESLRKSVSVSPATDLSLPSTIKTEPIQKLAKNTEPKEIKTVGSVTPQKPLKQFTVHSSVKNLFKVYSNLRLPSCTLNYNINPVVSMELDEVENYFKVRKLDMISYVRNAFTKPKKVARKSTSTPIKRENEMLIRTPTTDHISLKGNNSLNTDSPRGIKRRRSTSNNRTNSKKLFVAENCENLSSSISVFQSNFIKDVSDVCGISAKSHELHVCRICNAVYQSLSHLRKHEFKHSRCQFCKKKFSSLASKDRHIASYCRIHKIMKEMTNLPNIHLKKVEKDLEIRCKHREVLAIFPSIPGLDGKSEKVEDKSKPTDIIEILSDDESSHVTKQTAENKIQNKPIEPKITIINGSLNNIISENSTSDDIKLLKNLLISCMKVNQKRTTAAQTWLPSSESVKTNYHDLSFELKSLKHYLTYYRIPTEINFASLTKISYKYQSDMELEKKNKDWNNMVPIDVIKNEDLLLENIYNQCIPLLKNNTIEILSDSENDIESVKNTEQNFELINTDTNNKTTPATPIREKTIHQEKNITQQTRDTENLGEIDQIHSDVSEKNKSINNNCAESSTKNLTYDKVNNFRKESDRIAKEINQIYKALDDLDNKSFEMKTNEKLSKNKTLNTDGNASNESEEDDCFDETSEKNNLAKQFEKANEILGENVSLRADGKHNNVKDKQVLPLHSDSGNDIVAVSNVVVIDRNHTGDKSEQPKDDLVADGNENQVQLNSETNIVVCSTERVGDQAEKVLSDDGVVADGIDNEVELTSTSNIVTTEREHSDDKAEQVLPENGVVADGNENEGALKPTSNAVVTGGEQTSDKDKQVLSLLSVPAGDKNKNNETDTNVPVDCSELLLPSINEKSEENEKQQVGSLPISNLDITSNDKNENKSDLPIHCDSSCSVNNESDKQFSLIRVKTVCELNK